MQYRTLGKTGIKVSALGFGAMRLPVLPTTRKVNRDEAVRVIHRAFDLGVNYIDTAFGYHGGESEEVVGVALKGRRDKVTLSTKNPYKQASGADWRKNLETSLKRLDVECIDLYLFHFLAWAELSGPMSAPGGPVEEAEKARKEGKIRFLSFSCHDKPENMIKCIDTGLFSTLTCQYNLLDRANEKAMAHAHSKGMGVIIMGPVGGGRLVAPSAFQEFVPGGAKSTPEIALRFVLSNPAVSTALSGMNSLEQVAENVATASRPDPLTDEERHRVVALLEMNKRLADLYCTGCNYCMPCPNEVNIPANFRLMNFHRVYGLTDYARKQYRAISPTAGGGNKGRRAEECKECGKCEPKCPQKIPIMNQLKEVAKALAQQKR
jgi:predicted aldo/keto reductase-like oxidoreductase